MVLADVMYLMLNIRQNHLRKERKKKKKEQTKAENEDIRDSNCETLSLHLCVRGWYRGFFPFIMIDKSISSQVACVADSPGKGRGNWSERAGGEGSGERGGGRGREGDSPPRPRVRSPSSPLPFPGEPATQASSQSAVGSIPNGFSYDVIEQSEKKSEDTAI